MFLEESYHDDIEGFVWVHIRIGDFHMNIQASEMITSDRDDPILITTWGLADRRRQERGFPESDKKVFVVTKDHKVLWSIDEM